MQLLKIALLVAISLGLSTAMDSQSDESASKCCLWKREPISNFVFQAMIPPRQAMGLKDQFLFVSIQFYAKTQGVYCLTLHYINVVVRGCGIEKLQK